MRFTADLETTTDPDDCRPWALGICTIEKEPKFTCSNTLDFLFDFAKLHPNSTFYFHNLKFDGEFLLVWLFEHGFKLCKNKQLLGEKTFNTLISDKGQFYSLVICLDADNYITIYDSLKILPFSVEEVAKGFDLPISKLELDYKLKREVGHKLTDEEKLYLRHDVEIMARALFILFGQNLNKMTQGSNALADYKNIVGKARFKRAFPIMPYEIDKDIRRSYKGGFTYCDPRRQGQDVGEGIVLDVNSLYPSVMYFNKLPYGEPIYFEGQYEQDDFYDLYVQMFTCNFEIKPNHIPTIQIKKSNIFVQTEYLTSSNGEDVTLCLTSPDLELFMAHYNVYNIQYLHGWKFKSTKGLFTDYIDKWNQIKMESTLNGNKSMRTLAKLMMNALYGKFALNPDVQSKWPLYDNGQIRYTLGDKEQRNPIYIPVGSFITAWARYKTISSAQLVYDRFLYADTDSLHLLGTDIPSELEIDPVKLGAWDHEKTFTRARFLRQKTYVEEVDGKLEITCAGMPTNCYQYVNWDNFRVGYTFPGKLLPQHVKGGIVLKDVDFCIRE